MAAQLSSCAVRAGAASLARTPKIVSTRQTTHCTAETMGASRATDRRTEKATDSAVRSVCAMASGLGRTSAKIRMMKVMISVATKMPPSSKSRSATVVASADERMLTKVLPRSMAPITRSRSAINLTTCLARQDPSVARWCMRALETAVSAVSEPAKNAENTSSARMAARESVMLSVMARDLMGSDEDENIRREGENSGFRKRGADRVFRNLAAHESVSDAFGKNEIHPAAARFLVVAHVGKHLVGRRLRLADFRQARGQADAREMALDASDVLGGRVTELGRELESQDTAQRHAFAVDQPVGIMRRGFQAMTERMAKIKERAVAFFALVLGDDGRFHGTGMSHRMGGCLGIACERAGTILFQPGEEIRVAEEPVFDDLGIAAEQLALRQRRQHGGVGDDDSRLVKQPYQI